MFCFVLSVSLLMSELLQMDLLYKVNTLRNMQQVEQPGGLTLVVLWRPQVVPPGSEGRCVAFNTNRRRRKKKNHLSEQQTN